MKLTGLVVFVVVKVVDKTMDKVMVKEVDKVVEDTHSSPTQSFCSCTAKWAAARGIAANLVICSTPSPTNHPSTSSSRSPVI